MSPGATPSLCVVQVNHLCTAAVIMLAKQLSSIISYVIIPSAVRTCPYTACVRVVMWPPVLPTLVTWTCREPVQHLRSRLMVVRVHTYGLRPSQPLSVGPTQRSRSLAMAQCQNHGIYSSRLLFGNRLRILLATHVTKNIYVPPVCKNPSRRVTSPGPEMSCERPSPMGRTCESGWSGLTIPLDGMASLTT